MSSAEAAVHAAQNVVVAITVLALVAAAGFTLYRLAKGPTNLDRIIASDLMVGIAVAGFGLEVLLSDDETTLPIMLAVSLVGFIGAVSMARFVHDRRVTGPRDVRRSRRRGDGARPVVRGERPAGTEHVEEWIAAGEGEFDAPGTIGAIGATEASSEPSRRDTGGDA